MLHRIVWIIDTADPIRLNLQKKLEISKAWKSFWKIVSSQRKEGKRRQNYFTIIELQFMELFDYGAIWLSNVPASRAILELKVLSMKPLWSSYISFNISFKAPFKWITSDRCNSSLGIQTRHPEHCRRLTRRWSKIPTRYDQAVVSYEIKIQPKCITDLDRSKWSVKQCLPNDVY